MVVGADRSAEELAAIVSRRGEDRGWLHSRITAIPAELDYADFRSEMLFLTQDG